MEFFLPDEGTEHKVGDDKPQGIDETVVTDLERTKIQQDWIKIVGKHRLFSFFSP